MLIYYWLHEELLCTPLVELAIGTKAVQRYTRNVKRGLYFLTWELSFKCKVLQFFSPGASNYVFSTCE